MNLFVRCAALAAMLALLPAGARPLSAQSAATVGVELGYRRADFYGSGAAGIQARSGAVAGAYFRVPLSGWLSVQPGLLIASKGGTTTVTTGTPSGPAPVRTRPRLPRPSPSAASPDSGVRRHQAGPDRRRRARCADRVQRGIQPTGIPAGPHTMQPSHTSNLSDLGRRARRRRRPGHPDREERALPGGAIQSRAPFRQRYRQPPESWVEPPPLRALLGLPPQPVAGRHGSRERLDARNGAGASRPTALASTFTSLCTAPDSPVRRPSCSCSS